MTEQSTQPVLVTTPEQLADLESGSIVIAGYDAADTFEVDAIYQSYGRRWGLMDPSDRYDGEESYTDDHLIISSVRDGHSLYVVFDASTPKPQTPTLGELVLDGPDWESWRQTHPDNVTALAQHREREAKRREAMRARQAAQDGP